MPQPAISFHDVSHVYRQRGAPDFTALKGISFDIRAGESAAVLGRSGSGKSTLLNLIAGLDRSSSGTVRVEGAELGALSEAALTTWRGRTIGVVFQFFQLLPTLTVQENLLLAMEFVGVVPTGHRQERVEELLGLVGVADQAGKLPAHLSGGQQQRVAVARALVNQPKVLIADEPTGNLDSTSAEAVLDLFRALRDQGVTLVIVTHDEAVAAHTDRVLRLEDGQLERDTPNRKEA